MGNRRHRFVARKKKSGHSVDTDYTQWVDIVLEVNSISNHNNAASRDTYDILGKIYIFFPVPKKCTAFYPKLCILNFLALFVYIEDNTISKSLVQDSFRYTFWAMGKLHHTF